MHRLSASTSSRRQQSFTLHSPYRRSASEILGCHVYKILMNTSIAPDLSRTNRRASFHSAQKVTGQQRQEIATYI